MKAPEFIGKPLLLRQHLADGQLPDGTEFKVALGLPPTYIVVEFPEGFYKYSLRDLVDGALDARQAREAT